ncbi:MAG: 2-oxoglutarate dehydrogenase E1 component, partial [Chloroflexi bacterium]|nr:2-oxoglutarate dehydrogenase E1 component [Chloroflexota bacterium]
AGMARAAQERRDQPGMPHQDEMASLPVLMHGDAAFPGQGVVAETLNLSRLPGYRTGGTVHIIINNQVGFTTETRDSRSTLYASDLAKGFEVPIVHVNADDPEACLAAVRLAHAYRQQFRKDVLIDLVGYRRWGHNEGDEPGFTQPLLYQRITAHPTVRERWATELARTGVIAVGDADSLVARCWQRLEVAQAQPQPTTVEPNGRGRTAPRAVVTAVSRAVLEAINTVLTQPPAGFTVHPRLERLLQRRAGALVDGAVDWAHAEALAFGTIVADGTPIRLTGQDSQRGTFSQRHLVLHDWQTGAGFTALQNLPSSRAAFAVINSPLSENATLGFEYGYSVQSPETLVIWEAQFGDFINGAQVIVDQFIASARAKWRQLPALVLLLPHGYEGQGPEHSSARLERFIQLAASDNMRIVNCTTAAQYFHVLRRQAALLRDEPRPLIVMTPKSLLRHPLAASPVAELVDGRFRCLIDDPVARQHPDAIHRLVLCSGKVAIDLLASALRAEAEHVAIVRLEELYPFPRADIDDVLLTFPKLQEIIWVQEEPRNMGAWRYMAPRLRTLAGPHLTVAYIGRPRRASPAEGSSDAHAFEQARIVRDAFAGQPEPLLVEEHGVQHAG